MPPSDVADGSSFGASDVREVAMWIAVLVAALAFLRLRTEGSSPPLQCSMRQVDATTMAHDTLVTLLATAEEPMLLRNAMSTWSETAAWADICLLYTSPSPRD